MYGRRILILIPHPDDEVVGCCAAIGRARQQGAEVFGMCLTTGVPARDVFWPWQRAGYPGRVARRHDEARRVAELLGIELVSLSDVPTRQLRSHLRATLDNILAQVRGLRADMLWTPAYEGGHQDHDVASFLASRLRAEASVWEFSEYNFSGGKVRSQEFLAPNGSEQEITLTPEEQQCKRRALEVYASEKGNLGYVQTGREVFRPQADYDYVRPPHPGKLFYQRFQWAPFQPRVDYTQPEEVCLELSRFTESAES